MSGWSAKDVTKAPGKTITGIVTNEPISVEGWPITAGGSQHMVIKIKAAAVTVVGSITAKLQTAIGADYVDSKTGVIAATGDIYIKLNSEVTADQTFLPLLNKGQVVITTTNAGDTLSITSVEVLQEL